jgi:seryl-tRNA synthetase
MLELTRIRSEKAEIVEALKKRNIDAESVVQQIIDKDEHWREKKQDLDQILSESNQLAKQIGVLLKAGNQAEALPLKNKTAELKANEAELKIQTDTLEKEIQQLLYMLPNTPCREVVAGKEAADNQIVFESSTSISNTFKRKPHWDLCKTKDIVDFELGVKVTGAGFPFYKGKGAKLQRALIAFFLDEASNAGYTEYQTPILVNEASGIGTGQLPDKEGQMYHVTEDHLYLIPTAEVPLTNVYRDVILPDPNFSIKLTGFTPCFRREAGSYGKDVRGLNRLHQFDKVEIVRIEHPSNTERALNEMVDHVKKLLDALELPYRVLRLCGGDMGFASCMTYDFEVYAAAQDKWLEVSSVSRFDTFQSNRLKLRFKDEQKKSKLCHTLNGSALALPRIMASLIENFQDSEGNIHIPTALRKYTGFDTI